VTTASGYRAIPTDLPAHGGALEESGVSARCGAHVTKHLWAWNSRRSSCRARRKAAQIYEVKEENGAILANIEAELTYEFGGRG